MNSKTSNRGPSIGAWVMLAGIILAVPFAIAIAVLFVAFGVNPLMLSAMARQPVLAAVSLISIVFLILAGILFVIGDALYVVLPSFSRDAARRGYASYGTVLASLLLAIILSIVLQGIYTVGVLAAGGLAAVRGGAQLSPTLLVVAVASLELSLLLVLWIRVVRPGVITWQDMGLSTANLGRKVLIGLGTGVVIFAAASAVELILTNFGIQQTQIQQYEAVKTATRVQFAAVLLAGSVLAPLAEESFFRGYIVTGFLRHGSNIAAFLFSALLFAGAHLNWQAFLPIFIIGLILAFVFERTNSIVPTMIAHAMNNAIAFSALYFKLG